jgi:transcriptional regulator with XRE-family HTH domain
MSDNNENSNMNGTSEPAVVYLSQNIRALRRQRSLSQEELAQRIGLNRGNITSYENGTAEPKICNLLKLSNLFGVSVIDLIQKDLSEEKATTEAVQSFRPVLNGERAIIEHFAYIAEEIERVIEGLHSCCRFKTSNLEEVPRDMRIVLTNFEQLYEAARTLLRNYRELLDFIQYRVK